jgi:hypothetical protein
VAENKPAGTLVGTLTASDPNVGDGFIYTLIRTAAYPDNSAFAISGGELLTAKDLSYAAKSSYNIRVQVTDAGGLSFATTLMVRVRQVHQAPTDVVLSSYVVAQRQPIGTLVGLLSGTDPDTGDILSYSLVSGNGSRDNAMFTLLGRRLKTAAVFNYATQSVYKIRVRVTDQGGFSYEKPMAINVSRV